MLAHQAGKPGLRITRKTFKLLRFTELRASHVSLAYHSFPFSPVYYHSVLFFLATYWPFGRIRSDDFVMVSY